MKVFCAVLTVFLCVSLIEAGRKKYGGGNENGSDDGNTNLGKTACTSLMEGVLSALYQTSQCTPINSISGIIHLAGWLGDYNVYVLETTYYYYTCILYWAHN